VGVHFPWGSVLALRCGSFLDRPVGHCVSGPSPFTPSWDCAIVASVTGIVALQSRPFAWSGEGTKCRAIRAACFDRSRSDAPLRPMPFQHRGCELPSTLLGSRGAFIEPCRSLTLSWLLPSTPDRPPWRPMRYPSHAPRGWCDWRFYSWAVRATLRHAGEDMPGVNPKAPSVVSRTCEPKPTGQCHAYFLSFAWPRAPIRLLSTRAPRQAVTSSFLPASALPWSPRGLATSRRTRRAMRPIDFCYPYVNCVYPPPRLLPAFTTASFPAWAPHRVWARCGLTGGPSVFTTLEPLWWIDRTRCPGSAASRASRRPGLCFAWMMAWAWAFSSHGALVRPYLWHPCRLSLFHPCELGLRRLLGSPVSFGGARAFLVWGSRQDHRDRLLVKVDGSWWSGVPSIGKDPS